MLKGIRVIELAGYVAAPGASGLMADWGADVIKVEAAGGDPMRHYLASAASVATVNPVFELDNRGKRSIVLDIKNEHGLAALRALVRGADVFLTNLRPTMLKRNGLDWPALQQENPRLIYASISGFGLTGPDADRPAFDHTAFWARSGILASMTASGQEPPPPGTAVGDHVCSLATVAGILAAVIERDRTGAGKLIETSLLRSGTYAMGTDLSLQLQRGRMATAKTRAGAANPLVNFFMASDGHWFCLTARQAGKDWPNIARAVGHEEWLADERFATSRARKENGAALVELLDWAFAKMSLAELGQRLDAEDVVWAPLMTPAEVTSDPQAIAAGCFQGAIDATGETFRAPAPPVRFDGTDGAAAPRPAPLLGQHTAEILAELGYSTAQIALASEDRAAP